MKGVGSSWMDGRLTADPLPNAPWFIWTKDLSDSGAPSTSWPDGGHLLLDVVVRLFITI
jgi:hypothetical protein